MVASGFGGLLEVPLRAIAGKLVRRRHRCPATPALAHPAIEMILV
jgi:hypothetical protein